MSRFIYISVVKLKYLRFSLISLSIYLKNILQKASYFRNSYPLTARERLRRRNLSQQRSTKRLQYLGYGRLKIQQFSPILSQQALRISSKTQYFLACCVSVYIIMQKLYHLSLLSLLLPSLLAQGGIFTISFFLPVVGQPCGIGQLKPHKNVRIVGVLYSGNKRLPCAAGVMVIVYSKGKHASLYCRAVALVPVKFISYCQLYSC